MKTLIVDDLPPEACAMLQALYSRSPDSVEQHIVKVAERGAGAFMGSYYVGYGHKSIGDCGTTTIFIEGVSLLAAKAIQDWPLYNGQEASTRYLNMEMRPCINPFVTSQTQSLLQRTMEFYSYLMPQLTKQLSYQHPQKRGENETTWKKAVRARAFDIARGFLPAGVTTNLSWHTNLRQANDHLKQLRHHPLQEVRYIAHQILSDLRVKYESSFLHKEYEEEERWLSECSGLTYRYVEDHGFFANNFTNEYYRDFYITELANRPAKAEFPSCVRMIGDVHFNIPIDFGSYRDLQRHRSCVQEMPLLTIKQGFHSWYLDQIEEGPVKNAVYHFLDEWTRDFQCSIEEFGISQDDRQYYVLMGFKVVVPMRCNLPAAVYIAELRSGPHVHPTLRQQAQKMGQWLKSTFPELAMYHDMSEDAWTIERGNQDIVERTTE